jgi:signal peptidase I
MTGILLGIAALLVCAGLLGWLPLRRRYVAVTVRGQSMEPTYQDGEWLLVRRGGQPGRGQVVVTEHPRAAAAVRDPRLPDHLRATVAVEPPHRWLVKRVAAVAGDPVPREQVPALSDVPEHRVPPGKLVLLGDNRRASFDSRRHGYFDAGGVLGVVVRRLAIPRSAPPSTSAPAVTGIHPPPPAPDRGPTVVDPGGPPADPRSQARR